MKFLGDRNIRLYQALLMISSILIILFFVAFYLMSGKSSSVIIAGFISFIFLCILNYLYIRVFSVSYDNSNFYLKNLFVSEIVKTSKFIEVKPILIFDFAYRIVFDDASFIFLINSNQYYKNLFRLKGKREIAMELTARIKENQI